MGIRNKRESFINLFHQGKKLYQLLLHIVKTVERVTPLIPSENIYVVTNKDYEDKIRAELKDIKAENIFTEPANKETAIYN